MSAVTLTQSQLEAIAAALAELTGSEIGYLLQSCKMADPSPRLAKRRRLYNAFAQSQNTRRDRQAVLAFIRKAMKPERYAREAERFEPLREELNRALAFAGLAVDAAGQLGRADQARTLTEAARRANELRADLTSRGVHPDVLRFCREELLADNYFHAVLEAVKSVANKLRARTGLTDDGNGLVDRALSGEPPMLAINPLKTDSERSEQRGFANLVRGTFGMFRNTTAHEARILWAMTKEDAEDLLSVAACTYRDSRSQTRPISAHDK